MLITGGGGFVGSHLADALLARSDEVFILEPGGTSKVRFVSKEHVYGQSYEDIARRIPDATRMRTVLGVTAGVPLRVGLAKTVDWFRRSMRDG